MDTNIAAAASNFFTYPAKKHTLHATRKRSACPGNPGMGFQLAGPRNADSEDLAGTISESVAGEARWHFRRRDIARGPAGLAK
jgi:hypothetical protein